MVQVDIPVAFAVGGIFADAANRQIQRGGDEFYYGALLKNNLYQSFFFLWVPVYFLLNNFGWETTHMWWHESTVAAYPFYLPVFIIVFYIACNFGFILGSRLVREKRLWSNRIIYIAIFVYSGIWIFTQTGSTFRLGSYDDLMRGSAIWFYQDRTFLFMLIFTLIVWVGAMAWFIFNLIREGRNLP